MNTGFEYREQVGPGAAGRTVLDHLATRHSHSSLAVWRERIEGGEVFLGDDRAAPGAILRRGDWLAWRRPPWEEPPVPLAFAILHRDDHLLAVAKPRGLPSVPNGGFLEHTLLRLVRARFPEVTPMHRLGRGTSGLVLFAKTARAQAALKDQFRRREPERVYRAIVYGHPDPPQGTWRDRLVWDTRALIQKETHPGDPSGMDAVSHYRVVERFVSTSLIEVRLETGKRNQIRIQARLRGHTLVGEKRYVYGPDSLRPVGFARQALHAYRLHFRHPGDNRPLAFEAPLPRDMSDLLARLRNG